MTLSISGIKKNIETHKLTTFGIGGAVKYFKEINNINELVGILAWAKSHDISYNIMAGGSNIIFSDKLLPSLLIKINTKGVEINKEKVICSAGTPLSDLIESCIKHDLAGLERLSGIPGSVGGAIVGNAGAYGGSISEYLVSITIFDGRKTRTLKKKECHFTYRESVLKKKKWIILEANFKLKRGNSKKLAKISEEIIKIRLKKYRAGLRCPGSFFKNVLVSEISNKTLKKISPLKIIEGKIPTGYLLEEVGAKGMVLGGIQIANHHGNLLVNTGGAKYRDVKKLAKILKSKVKQKFGIKLEEEIRYIT